MDANRSEVAGAQSSRVHLFAQSGHAPRFLILHRPCLVRILLRYLLHLLTVVPGNKLVGPLVVTAIPSISDHNRFSPRPNHQFWLDECPHHHTSQLG